MDEKYLSKSGDVVIPTSGETPDEIATATCVMVDNVVLAGDLIILKNSILNGQILSYIINHKISRKISKIAQGKSVVHIQPKEIAKISICYPSDKEQNKLSLFFELINKKIQFQQQLIENLKLYKKGYFSSVNKEIITEEYFIKDIVEEYCEKTTVNDQYPILSSTISGIKRQDDYFNKQTASENTVGYKIIPYGYFTYRSMSDTGIFRFNCQQIIEKGIVSPAYPVFRIIDHNSKYIEYLLNDTDSIKSQLLVLKEGGTRYALSFSKFTELKIKLPKIEIQNSIANQIALFDRMLSIQDTVLNKLIDLKTALLQQMFI